ncbi:MAG: hypothetical protein ACXWCZ_04935, partial [Flavisolibacter sp.]
MFYIFANSFNGGSIILPYLLIFPGINKVSWPESIRLRRIRVEAATIKKIKKVLASARTFYF